MYDGNRFELMADYNAWMNARIYALCAGLSDAERKRDRGAFFKSIHATLNHILWGDRAWMARLAGKSYGPFTPIGTELYADFAELHAARTAMDREIREWAAGLTQEWLEAPHSFTSQVYKTTRVQPAWVFVTHMFNHQTHHRGQLTTLLAQMGLDFGITDIPMMPQLAGGDGDPGNGASR